MPSHIKRTKSDAHHIKSSNIKVKVSIGGEVKEQILEATASSSRQLNLRAIRTTGKPNIPPHHYERPIHSIFTSTHDIYVRDEHRCTLDVRTHIDDNFVWTKSTQVAASTGSLTHTEDNSSVKFTLYMKKREGDGDWSNQYSDGLTAILSVRPSTIPGAGLGLFAERAFRENQIISVYLGDKMRRYYKAPSTYALQLNYQHNIQPNNNRLYLGAHFANDAKFLPEVPVASNKKKRRRIGHPVGNNCDFEGVYIVARSQIIVGKEILLDYNYETIK